MKTKTIEDRMKIYEGLESNRILMPNLPVIVRLDGKSFHTFTKGLARPYDARLHDLFVSVTKKLVEESHATIGYTQSDEITLIIDPTVNDVYYGWRVQKIVSILTSVATAHFNSMLPLYIPEKAKRIAMFDCRAWVVPSKQEAVNVLVWREQDCTRNSVQMAAQHYFSQNQLHGKNGQEMRQMLLEKNVNWDEYPVFFKRGTYIQRRVVSKAFTTEDLELLPLKHQARLNPDLIITRNEVSTINMPPILHVTNRVEVVFDGDTPHDFYNR